MKLKELLEKRRKSLSAKSKITFTIEIALFHEEESNFNEAFDEYNELLSLSLEENDVIMQAKAYRHMGECKLELQRPVEALEHIKMYLKSAKSCGDLFEIQRASVTIGRCYLDLALTLKVPKEKETSLNQAEASFLRSLQLTQKLSQGPTPSGSTRSDSKLENEFAEMRAVSMFNLGLVNREKASDKLSLTAEKYLSQCSTLCLNRKLYDMFLRATMERVDIKCNMAIQCLVSVVDQKKAKPQLEEAMKIVKSSLAHLTNVSFTSDMKKLRKDIQSVEARVLLVAGHVLKAAKKYRGLGSRYQSNREYYNEKMTLCIKLNKKLKSVRAQNVTTTDNILLGQLYEELGVPQLACKYYKQAMESIKDRSEALFIKVVNRLITVNSCCGCHSDNLVLLQLKLKKLLREQTKAGLSDRLSARVSCGLILRMLDSWTQSGTLGLHRDKVVAFVTQMESLSTLADSVSVKIKSTKASVEVYEALSKDNQGQYQEEIRRGKEKLERLLLTRGHSEDDVNGDDEFNCLSPDDEFAEAELSSVELCESDYENTLSSDSDMDHTVLTECQIEELEAVGKRVASNKNKSFVKRNEKGETMLHVAAIKGSVKQTEHLISQMKHPVDLCDTAGWTALHDAANHGHTKVVEVLLNNGADIEHKGPAIDRSTPLMEAVNGGNIDTAMLLIERGANLWHKNSSGENVGDCIDAWRQRCKDNESYREPEARAYKQLTLRIREKIGSRYVEWCRERRGSSTIVSKPESTKNKYVTYRDSRRTIEANESDKEVEGEEVEDEDDPVVNYCNAMTSLGSKKRKEVKNKENCVQEAAGFVIGDDWLDNDMAKSGKTVVSEPHYGSYSRAGGRKRRSVFEEENGSSKLCRQQSERVSSSQSEDLFESDNAVFSTQTTVDVARSTPKTVTVTYRQLPMVIPLTDNNCTVQWLLEELARRYSFLVPLDPVSAGPGLRISRQDGALLMPTDPLLLALSDVTAWPVKLDAVDTPLSTTMVHLSTQSLMPDQYSSLCESLRTSLSLGNLDLGAKHLGSNVLEFLASLQFTQRCPAPLTRISFRNNDITDELLNKRFTNSHGTMSLSQFVGNHSTTLEELDVSDNQFSGVALSDFLHTMRSKGLSRLKVLNLSGNPIGSEDFCVMSLIMKPALMSFPSIDELRLTNCCISNLSELSTPRSGSQDSHLLPTSLRSLDISNNPCLLKRDCVDLMFWKYVNKSLESLTLRGCGYLIADYENLSGSSPNHSALSDFIASIVDLINNKLSRVHSLDIGNCNLDSESLSILNRLFTNKICPLRSLICDSNQFLSRSISCWSGLVHNLSQPLCTIDHLVIDLPLIANYEDFLTVVDSIQGKILRRIGRALVALNLLVDRHLIDFIKDAVLDHRDRRLSDDFVRAVHEDNDETLVLHFSVCFILSVLDLLRDRYGTEDVEVSFEGQMVKLHRRGE